MNEESIMRLKAALLRKDTISVQENCENTPLHSAILGGETPAAHFLLNFQDHLNDGNCASSSEIEEKFEQIKTEMLSSRNQRLSTPLMLCVS